ncbi:MAG: nitrilase-related carbon-nitrogen hydrolase [Lachnospiraceae bacterium]|nr:nitrilase-related carbon-nitrogen hydrolase [Lachnospiraceae bacterium]
MKQYSGTKTASLALVVGGLAFLFSGGRWNCWITAWLWPAAFLFFSRRAKTGKQLLPLMAVIAAGTVIKWWNVLQGSVLLSALLCLVWSLFWSLPFVLEWLLRSCCEKDSLTRKQRRGRCSLLKGVAETFLFPALFVTTEFLRSFVFAGSLGILAYSQTGILPLVQVVSLVGSYGLSFLICWFGSVLVSALERDTGWRVTITIYGGLLAAVLLFGSLRLAQAPSEYDSTVTTASVISPYYRQFSDGEYEIFPLQESEEYLISQVERAAREGAVIACWNEEAFTILDGEEQEFLILAENLSSQYGMTMLLGYEMPDTDNSEEGLSVNKLVILTPEGNRTEYVKTHLVPVMETLDFVKGSGNLPTVVTEEAVISAAICFDDLYVSYIHGFGAETNEHFRDTELLFIPSWDWHSVENAHSDASEFRAVENGFSLVKPSYDGISTAVDPYGRVIRRFDTEDTGFDTVQLAEIPVMRVHTFYSEYGTFIDLLFLCMGLLMILIRIPSVFRVTGRRKYSVCLLQYIKDRTSVFSGVHEKEIKHGNNSHCGG